MKSKEEAAVEYALSVSCNVCEDKCTSIIKPNNCDCYNMAVRDFLAGCEFTEELAVALFTDFLSKQYPDNKEHYIRVFKNRLKGGYV